LERVIVSPNRVFTLFEDEKWPNSGFKHGLPGNDVEEHKKMKIIRGQN
jgi:hypothetical protein